MPPLVSIIVPCYNGARYLERLVNSLRPMLSSKVEIIFADDGSTDGSLELVEKLMPSAVCLRQDNGGPGAARNRGVEAARGEFVQLLDVDDTMECGKMEAQLEFARSKGVDVVYSDWRMVVVDGNCERCEEWVHAEAPTEIVQALLAGWWFPPVAALVRKSAILAVGGCDETLRNTCDDFDLWVRLGIAGFGYGYLPGRYANYYRYLHVRSESRKNRREFCEGEARVILKAIRLLEARGESTLRRRGAAARRLHAVARNVHSIDEGWYRRLIQQVFDLDPDFRPTGTLGYCVVARVLGLEKAEKLAAWRRKFLLRQAATV